MESPPTQSFLKVYQKHENAYEVYRHTDYKYVTMCWQMEDLEYFTSKSRIIKDCSIF